MFLFFFEKKKRKSPENPCVVLIFWRRLFFRHPFSCVEGRLQVLFPMFLAVFPFGLFGESGELVAVVVLHLVGVVGDQSFGVAERGGDAVLHRAVALAVVAGGRAVHGLHQHHGHLLEPVATAKETVAVAFRAHISVRDYLSFPREPLQSPLVQSLHGPFVHRDGPDAAIDLQGGLVPVEADPLHAAAIALHGDLGQVLQQGFPVSPTPLLGKDEQVFEIEPLAPHEGGEIVEEEGEADHGAVLLREDHLGGTLHEQGMIDGGFVGHHLVGTFLVNGQLLDEFQDEARLFGLRRTDIETIAHILSFCYTFHPASERLNARSAINTIQAQRSMVTAPQRPPPSRQPLQQLNQHPPDVVDGRELHALAGGVRLHDARTDAGDLDAGIVLHEEARLQHEVHRHHTGTPA